MPEKPWPAKNRTGYGDRPTDPRYNAGPGSPATQFRTRQVSSVPCRNVQLAPRIYRPSRSERARLGAPSTQLAEGGVNSYLGCVCLEEPLSGPTRKLRHDRVRFWSL